MKINGLNGANTQIGGMNMKATDSVSKNIQNQNTNAQKQQQDTSANKDMSIEEKMKKRQEILQEITDLNNQLRQHQMELRKEKQQAKGSSMNDMLGGSTKTAPKAGKHSAGLSQASMKAIMSADSAMAQAQVQGSVATRMEGRAGVLESEIKLDSARGGNVEAKKEELAEVQEKMEAAQEAQLNTLADANKELEEAAKADQKAEKTEDKKGDKKTDKKDTVSNEKDDKSVIATDDNKSVDTDATTEVVSVDMTEAVDASVPDEVTYTHVDVRLQEGQL